MTPFEFANRHFGEYKVKGDEIVPYYCPYCNGGEHGDKGTFALNTQNLTYNCKRGTCGKEGTFSQLCMDFGEHAEGTFDRKIPRKKHYKRPKAKLEPPKSKVEEYLTRRGFSKSTWERRKVGEVNGAVAMPYFENGNLVLMKFRTPEKPAKHWREEGGKPVFWGMDLCDPSKPLVIVEGEMDALALDECGVENVVSVPSGNSSDMESVENCWEWLEQFRKIIIWPDNDPVNDQGIRPGEEMAKRLIAKLGEWRCYIVKSEHKDANVSLYRDGKEKTKAAVENAQEVSIAGIIRMAQVKSVDYTKIRKVRSGIKAVDKIIGGYMMGLITVWTGINSSGKSTFISQELCEALDQGFNVCAYSGELTAGVFKTWMDMQLSGPGYIKKVYDPVKEEDVPAVDVKVTEKLNAWYYDRMFLYDSMTGGATDKDIFKIFEYAARRYNCEVFLVDNLMTTTFTSGEKDFYRAQSQFIGQLKDFARKFNVHVHVVAHPRKTDGKLTKMDVAGSGDITNRADNVLAIHRLSPEEKEKDKYYGLDNLIQVFKSRLYGMQDVEIGMKFSWMSKRFYLPSGNANKEYGWTKIKSEVESDQCPF
jgi:twinkle protein